MPLCASTKIDAPDVEFLEIYADQVEFDEGQWVAVERYTGMFGEGDTRHDALADLAQGLNVLRHELAMNRVNLAPRLQGQLAALEAAIGPAE